MTKQDMERQAREAMKARFARRLATEEQRNAYEVGFFEALQSTATLQAKLDAAEARVNVLEGALLMARSRFFDIEPHDKAQDYYHVRKACNDAMREIDAALRAQEETNDCR